MMHNQAFLMTKLEIEQFREFLTDRENAVATVEKYLRDVDAFADFLGEDLEVTRERLLAYKSFLTENYKPGSVNSKLASLNQFLIFRGSGCMRLHSLKTQKILMQEESRNLTKEEYERLLAVAEEQDKKDLAMIMETIAATGIRISELEYITAEAVRAGRAEVHNKGKYRRILMPGALRKKLDAYIRKCGIKSGPVFVTRTGKPQNRSNIWKRMKALSEAAGVLASKVFPHNLRHLFARTYYKLTRDLTGLADILGHSSVEVTRIYTADTEEHYQKELDRMDFVQERGKRCAGMA